MKPTNQQILDSIQRVYILSESLVSELIWLKSYCKPEYIKIINEAKAKVNHLKKVMISDMTPEAKEMVEAQFDITANKAIGEVLQQDTIDIIFEGTATKALKTKYKILFNALIVGSIAVIMMYIFGSAYALKANALLVLAGVSYFAIASIFGVSKLPADSKSDALSIRTLRIFYLFSLLFWIIAILPLLGLVPIGEVAMHSLLIYSLTSGLVFFLILQLRSKSLLKQETIRSNNMEVLAEQERKRREEQSMLMTMLSHEIKTPLSVLKLVVDRKVSGSDLEGHANRAVNNINSIINRCLQLGKLDAKEIHLNPSIINVYDLLMSIISDHHSEDRFNIIGAEDLTIYLDQDLLKVVFSNLIENALKYSPDKSLIELNFGFISKNEISGFNFEIKNVTGPMGAPDEKQVFKKYYRNLSATKISGSGLGLYLAYELTHVLGGGLFYRREENQAVFGLWVPN